MNLFSHPKSEISLNLLRELMPLLRVTSGDQQKQILIVYMVERGRLKKGRRICMENLEISSLTCSSSAGIQGAPEHFDQSLESCPELDSMWSRFFNFHTVEFWLAQK